MAYTVKKLAELSGVTERTLRWYDKIGLLKPTFYSSNGYRHYEEEQVLMLQQILFFRELDFSLDDIRRIVTGNDFDKIKALNVHKKNLQKNLERTKLLIKTVDRTRLHLRGKIMMDENEIYDGFKKWAKGKGPESFFLGTCENIDDLENNNEKLVFKNLKKSEGVVRDKSFYEDIERSYKEIYGAIVKCLENKLDPASDDVQLAIRKHHQFASKFHNCTKEVYKALAKLYLEKPEFNHQLEAFHPKLAKYLSKCMKIFAENNL